MRRSIPIFLAAVCAVTILAAPAHAQRWRGGYYGGYYNDGYYNNRWGGYYNRPYYSNNGYVNPNYNYSYNYGHVYPQYSSNGFSDCGNGYAQNYPPPSNNMTYNNMKHKKHYCPRTTRRYDTTHKHINHKHTNHKGR